MMHHAEGHDHEGGHAEGEEHAHDDAHAHHGPKLLWHIHIAHKGHEAHGEAHSGGQKVMLMVQCHMHNRMVVVMELIQLQK